MWLIFLGHILGDYFLQSKYMALNKNKDIDVCIDHCVIYAVCMLVCCHHLVPLSIMPMITFMGCITVSHYLLDYYALGQVWLWLIKRRIFATVQDEWNRIFTAIVYVVVDNTLHILCAIGALWLLGAKLWV